MTHDYEEADLLLLLHIADVLARHPFTELHICSPILMYFFLLFTSIQYFVQIQHSRLVAGNRQERY